MDLVGKKTVKVWLKNKASMAKVIQLIFFSKNFSFSEVASLYSIRSDGHSNSVITWKLSSEQLTCPTRLLHQPDG